VETPAPVRATRLPEWVSIKSARDFADIARGCEGGEEEEVVEMVFATDRRDIRRRMFHEVLTG